MVSICIMQPAYLPWIGYFQRLAFSDLLVSLDHVKIDENNKTKFTNRNRILTANGPTWLTIPYLKGSSPGLIINELAIDNSKKWQKKHWDIIRINYRHSPYFREHAPFFEDFYSRPHEMLVDAIEETTSYMLEYFDCNIPVRKSSTLGSLRSKSELNLDICQTVGAQLYIAGPFSRDYLDLSIFMAAGIRVMYHDFMIKPYLQTRPGFTPFLSAMDLMFNVSRAEARDIIKPAGMTLAEK